MSPRTSNRLTRILAMVPWVLANPGVSVSTVCDRFGYTRRELLADLDLLFVCGLPGYGPAELMVAYVEDEAVIIEMAEYFEAAPRLNPAESVALLAAGMTMIGSGQASPELVGAVEKISRSLLPPEEGEMLTVDLPLDGGLVATLREAANLGQVVRVEYRSMGTDETTIRELEPWSVFTSLGNTYLSGWCRKAGAERTFRVDRMRWVEVTGERFEPPGRTPEPNVRYEPRGGDSVSIIDLFPGAEWVSEYYPVEVLERTDGRLRVRFSAVDPGVTGRLLVRLGPRAALVEGSEVAEATQDLRARILARYQV